MSEDQVKGQNELTEDELEDVAGGKVYYTEKETSTTTTKKSLSGDDLSTSTTKITSDSTLKKQ